MTTISNNQLYHFIVSKIDSELDAKEAKSLGIEKEFQGAIEDLDIEEIQINEIMNDKDLYEQFATLYVEEKEQKSEAKDKEKQKEEQIAVKDKNEAGV